MMRCLAIIVFIISCMACTHKNKTPSDIISREEMTSLVWDVMLVDQYSQEYELGDSVKNRKAERSRLYQEVFDLHKTSRKDFLKSFNYYLSRPDLTKIIFDTLAARGSRERERSFRIKKPAK